MVSEGWDYNVVVNMTYRQLNLFTRKIADRYKQMGAKAPKFSKMRGW